MFNIDSFFNDKNKPLNNIKLGVEFDEFIKKLDINKTTKKISARTYYLLKCQLQKTLEQDYNDFIMSYINNNDDPDQPNIYNTPKEFILECALEYLKARYNALRKYDSKFSKLNEIEKKFDIKPIDEFNIKVV